MEYFTFWLAIVFIIFIIFITIFELIYNFLRRRKDKNESNRSKR